MSTVMRAAVSVILAAGTTIIASASADAAPPPRPPEARATLVGSTRAIAADVAAALVSTPPAAAAAAIGQHVSEQARAGRLVDAKNVRAADVAGGRATWELGSTVDELRMDRYTSTAGTETGDIIGLTLIGSEDQGEQATQPGGLTGAGMTGSSSLTGGSTLANYCQTWTASGSSVTACVQKYKPTNDGSSTRDYYAYNRWGTASGRVVDFALDYKVTKFDMRSRPRAGYESRTKGMNDYFPNDSSQLCAEGGSVGLGVGSLSFTIGLTNCSEKYPVPNATTKTMGLVYDAGAIFETRVKGVDYEQEVWSYQGELSPSLGFYNYGKFCQGTYLTCTATIGTDGW